MIRAFLQYFKPHDSLGLVYEIELCPGYELQFLGFTAQQNSFLLVL
jgi:hypothetical protein